MKHFWGIFESDMETQFCVNNGQILKVIQILVMTIPNRCLIELAFRAFTCPLLLVLNTVKHKGVEILKTRSFCACLDEIGKF